MAKEIKKVEGPATGSFICYRGIKIKPAIPSTKNISVVETRQIEIGPYGSFSIKVTGKEDWMAKVQAQKDNTGSAILKKLVKANDITGLQTLAGQTALRAEDCGDCSGRPETLQDMRDQLKAGEAASAQINAIAKQYGLTGDEFIEAFTKGNLNELIASKKAPETEEEKGE